MTTRANQDQNASFSSLGARPTQKTRKEFSIKFDINTPEKERTYTRIADDDNLENANKTNTPTHQNEHQRINHYFWVGQMLPQHANQGRNHQRTLNK